MCVTLKVANGMWPMFTSMETAVTIDMYHKWTITIDFAWTRHNINTFVKKILDF